MLNKEFEKFILERFNTDKEFILELSKVNDAWNVKKFSRIKNGQVPKINEVVEMAKVTNTTINEIAKLFCYNYDFDVLDSNNQSNDVIDRKQDNFIDNETVFLSIPEASKKLGIGERTLKNWCKENRIPHINVGVKRMIDIPKTLEVLRSGSFSE